MYKKKVTELSVTKFTGAGGFRANFLGFIGVGLQVVYRYYKETTEIAFRKQLFDEMQVSSIETAFLFNQRKYPHYILTINIVGFVTKMVMNIKTSCKVY